MIWRVLSYPRFRLATLPTPLEKAKRLGEKLRIDLWIKRDDVMELALGGNKARKLEFIIGHALSQGYDTIITLGAYHSNHVRLSIAAARRAGLEAYAVLYRHHPSAKPEKQGNILLDELLGGRIVYAESREEADELVKKLARDLESAGKRPYIVPAGGANEYGVMGYALAAMEILQQSLERGFKPSHIVHATGTCATQAGLILGLKMLGVSGTEVVGISVGRSAKYLTKQCIELLESASKLLGLGYRFSEDDVVIYEEYGFGGYGVITREVVEVMKETARLEGLILDPVYTAKAMYGLMDLANKGAFKGPVVFIHTGGAPVLFQYGSIVAEYLG